MAGNDESNMNEMTSVDNCDESNIMSNFEIHSTPSASQDKIVELDVTDQSNVTEDSGVQLTPTSTKCNNKLDDDIMSILRTISTVSYTHLDVYKRQVLSDFLSADRVFVEVLCEVLLCYN